ncbi:hypothetical protein TPHA_0M00790 [Tetrapisispora phaffii CBS 4417]|uniref:N-terminal acetyltransferase B complex subunit MDM20 n=1 Tax=Tetrapisispora phaffii (strain ATCC 24235 / CBS 4417 / NBRC 1672 / NRRL Y-8282 / UCD 70-5) TaxID=1071381 RepID=G8C0D9_TETPH|nr:hypothetical protein TPHA_0M00790 [Tetrapisispora phaffii CBS 4417]CCE65654.1 hypothetical protein TPHA_0M00790 [Tetrapisispora phaffii CBS 4417]
MSDRTEKEIFELIEKSNFKQCNVKIALLRKQFPNSSYYVILELFAKFKQSPKKFNYETELNSKYGLQGKEYVNDRKALNLLHTLFIEYSKFEEALNVYEKAMFKYPSFQLAMEWFDKSISDGHYKYMAKASLQLSKYAVVGKNSTLDKRNYSIWYAISVLALFRFKRDTLTATELKLFPMLAFKNLEEIKPFHNSEEYIIYCSVCEALFIDLCNENNENNEKARLIVNEILPTLSSEVNLNLKKFIIKYCAKIEDYELLYKSSKKILESIDDYSVLKSFIKASKHIGKSNEETKKLIIDLLGPSRNARLAYLECDVTFTGKIDRDSVMFYLEKFHHKQCCVVDLNAYKEYLEVESVLNYMSELEPKNDIHDVNTLHFSNLTSNESSEKAINLYNSHKHTLNKKMKTDYSILSTSIIKLVEESLSSNGKNPSLNDVLFSLSLLENYQTKDPHNFDTKTWIIALYMHLGCVSQAYSHFADLKIKNVQSDIMHHLIYTRMSSLFPHKSHPYIQHFLTEKENLYEKSLPRLTNFIKISFEREAYSKIMGMLDFRNRLVSSSFKWLSDIEETQLARLTNNKRGTLIQKNLESWRKINMINGAFNFSDNRDWSRFGEFVKKDNLPYTFQYLKFTDMSMKVNFIKELMIYYLSLGESNSTLDNLIQETIPSDKLVLLKEHLTPIEAWSFNIFYDLYKNEGSSLNDTLEYIPSKEELSTWRLSNYYITKLATLKTLDNMQQISDKKLKESIKKQLQELRENCDDLYKSYSSEIISSSSVLSSTQKKILNSLDYKELKPELITDGILKIQKAVRDL